LKPEICIRADGSSSIGLGHLIRCSALAHMLKNEYTVNFYCKDIPETLIAEFKDNDFGVVRIHEEDEFLRHLNRQITVILDGYHFDNDYQKRIKASEAKLVCIDDLHDKDFVADLIINSAPGIKPQDYKALSFTQYALGLEYALVRPAFLEQSKKSRTVEKIETLLICFGGSDPDNLTEKTLLAAREFEAIKMIIVITGATYNSSHTIEMHCRQDGRIKHLHNLNEKQMLDAMLISDLAIVPSSTILFEVFSVGMPVISGFYVANQMKLFRSFMKMELIYGAENFTDRAGLMNSIGIALNDNPMRLIVNQKKYFNGNAKQNFIQLFSNL
jgi:UDP-2,4-diacetamido-2,4,6-trideoxy-beta-L-altropyranose hydrolase